MVVGELSSKVSEQLALSFPSGRQNKTYEISVEEQQIPNIFSVSINSVNYNSIIFFALNQQNGTHEISAKREHIPNICSFTYFILQLLSFLKIFGEFLTMEQQRVGCGGRK